MDASGACARARTATVSRTHGDVKHDDRVNALGDRRRVTRAAAVRSSLRSDASASSPNPSPIQPNAHQCATWHDGFCVGV